MKIAIVSSNEQLMPPPDNVIIASHYVASTLAEGLSAKKHEVYSIAGQGSTIKTKRFFSRSKPFFEVIDKKQWEKLDDQRLMWQLITPFEMDLNLSLLDFLKTNQVDIVHFHSIIPLYGLPFALRTNLPCIFTLHGTSSRLELEVIKTFVGKNIYFVPISNNQRRNYQGINFVDTVYNGIPLGEYAFNQLGGEAMVLTGRIKPEKGFEQAMEVAQLTQRKLILSGDVRASQEKYFYDIIQPKIKINPNLIHFFGFVNHSMMDSFFERGKLMLFPIQWEEPFGLVMVEAMATGTPVVAFARGAVPEVIKDGVTGLIVNPSDKDIRGSWLIKKTGIAGLCEAVEKIYAMPKAEYQQMRRNCRQHVEANFTVEKMVAGYEKVYQKVLEQP